MDKFVLKETKKKDPHLAVHITAKHWKGTIINIINCLISAYPACFLHNQRTCIFHINSLLSKRFRRFFRPVKTFFTFWRRENGASTTLMEGAGRGRGGEKRKRLPANPMILKNAPLTLSQLDKFIA